jgi:hypothetical protein
VLRSAEIQYQEFGSDIKSLVANLSVLREVLRRASEQSKAQIQRQEFTGLNNVHEIFGDFKQTLSDCEKLLLENACFVKRDGFVNNIVWIVKISGEVLSLRERVRFHHIKLSHFWVWSM